MLGDENKMKIEETDFPVALTCPVSLKQKRTLWAAEPILKGNGSSSLMRPNERRKRLEGSSPSVLGKRWLHICAFPSNADNMFRRRVISAIVMKKNRFVSICFVWNSIKIKIYIRCSTKTYFARLPSLPRPL